LLPNPNSGVNETNLKNGRPERQRRSGSKRRKRHVKSLNSVFTVLQTTHFTTSTLANNFVGTRRLSKRRNKACHWLRLSGGMHYGVRRPKRSWND
jgi:hypothetical protein